VHFGVGYLGRSHSPLVPAAGLGLELTDVEPPPELGDADEENFSLGLADGETVLATTVGLAL
jgi:hypothetical protein